MQNLTPYFLLHEFVFLATGAVIFVFAIKAKALLSTPPQGSAVTSVLLIRDLPLKSALGNAISIFITFVFGLLGLFSSGKPVMLRLHAWMVVGCAIFTLVLGLIIWITTLQTRARLDGIWTQQTPEIQGILQDRFQCCGYWNSTAPRFVTNDACPSVFAAAQTRGCVSPFTSYANWYLQIIFTTMFGIVGVDALVVLAVSLMVTLRRERLRELTIDRLNPKAY